MITRILTFFIVFCFITATSLIGQTATPAQIEQSKKVAAKLVKDTNNRVDVKLLTGQKLKGHLDSVESDTFTFTEKKSGKSRSVTFSEVSEITNTKFGKSSWIVIGALAGAGTALLLILTAACRNEGTC